MREKFLAVVAANKARQTKARELNARSGENLFKVYSPEELLEFTLQNISGARRMSEVGDPSSLLLPPLDEVLAGKIVTENPDTVEVFGDRFAVTYEKGTPEIGVIFRPEDVSRWRNLPAEGIRLPGGKEVTVCGWIEGVGSVRALSSHFLKGVVDLAGRGQWERFVYGNNKPDLPRPDGGNPTSRIPPVYTHQYGVCSVTGVELLGYGVVIYTPPRWVGQEEFETKWFRDSSTAEGARLQSEQVFRKRQEELAKVLSKEAGEIREVTIDRRGEHRRPELNGRRIDNKEGFPFTPPFFWGDLLFLVERYGRGQKAFAIYKGEDPLLLCRNREELEAVLPQVQNLVRGVGHRSTPAEKSVFWRKLEDFRFPQEATPPPKRVSGVSGSLGDALSELGL